MLSPPPSGLICSPFYNQTSNLKHFNTTAFSRLVSRCLVRSKVTILTSLVWYWLKSIFCAVYLWNLWVICLTCLGSLRQTGTDPPCRRAVDVQSAELHPALQMCQTKTAWEDIRNISRAYGNNRLHTYKKYSISWKWLKLMYYSFYCRQDALTLAEAVAVFPKFTKAPVKCAHVCRQEHTAEASL